MFSFGNNFRRRVSVSHKHGGLVVRIVRHNDRTTYILLLLAFTAGFVFFSYVLSHRSFVVLYQVMRCTFCRSSPSLWCGTSSDCG